MLELPLSVLFALALGFVVSGIVSNVFRMVAGGRSPLAMQPESDWRRLAMVALLVFAGPDILVRAASKSLRIGDWPASYTVGCIALAGFWSLVLGFCALALIAP